MSTGNDQLGFIWDIAQIMKNYDYFYSGNQHHTDVIVKKYGCIDDELCDYGAGNQYCACNYDSSATDDNYSCVYPEEGVEYCDYISGEVVNCVCDICTYGKY